MPRLPEHYFLEITQSLDKMAFSDKLLVCQRNATSTYALPTVCTEKETPLYVEVIGKMVPAYIAPEALCNPKCLAIHR